MNRCTTYVYDTTSGKLTQRNLPVVTAANIRTTYGYDAGGRLSTETVTRESGGTTNLYKTTYAYALIAASSGGGRTLLRTEASWQTVPVTAWIDDFRVMYKYDALEREYFEEREDYNTGAHAFQNRYDITQAYDKCGNRTGYDKNVAGGFTASYGAAYNLTYTYNSKNNLTGITNADDATYNCVVTSDDNMNITQVEEAAGPGTSLTKNRLYAYFDYDDLNRLIEHKTKRYVAASFDWQWTKRSFTWDGIGRLVGSNYKQWLNGGMEPAGDSLEHVYDQDGKFVQNYDGSSAYGKMWHWAGADHEHAAPLKSPNADTASQTAYNVAVAGGKGDPQRRSFVNPTTQGDERLLFGQGRPQAKSASGAGADWAVGTVSQPQNIGQGVVESRLFYTGTVTATDMDRATDAREAGRIGIFGSIVTFAGSSGRAMVEAIGRDLNPLGRGDGGSYVGGQLALGRIAPSLPMSTAAPGSGNSVNNGCQSCMSNELLRTFPPAPDPNEPHVHAPDRDYYIGNWYEKCDCGALCSGRRGGLDENPCCGYYNPAAGSCDCRGVVMGDGRIPDTAADAELWCFRNPNGGWAKPLHFNRRDGRWEGQPPPGDEALQYVNPPVAVSTGFRAPAWWVAGGPSALHDHEPPSRWRQAFGSSTASYFSDLGAIGGGFLGSVIGLAAGAALDRASNGSSSDSIDGLDTTYRDSVAYGAFIGGIGTKSIVKGAAGFLSRTARMARGLRVGNAVALRNMEGGPLPFKYWSLSTEAARKGGLGVEAPKSRYHFLAMEKLSRGGYRLRYPNKLEVTSIGDKNRPQLKYNYNEYLDGMPGVVRIYVHVRTKTVSHVDFDLGGWIR